MRKWLKPQQDEAQYTQLAAELEILLQLEDQKYLKVYFSDESGFCLDPTVPYGWQPCGKYTAIVPQKSQRRHVLDFYRGTIAVYFPQGCQP